VKAAPEDEVAIEKRSSGSEQGECLCGCHVGDGVG
jgi:hypothetical protein